MTSFKTQTILDVVEEARSHGLDHVTLKVRVSDEALFQELRENGLSVVDKEDGAYTVTWK